MSSEIERAIQSYRNALLAREAQATIAIGNAYRQTRATLLKRIEVLAKATEGRTLTPGEIARWDRAQALLSQVDAEMTRLAAGSQTVITRGQTAVIDLAQTQARGLAIATAQAAGESALAATIGSSWNRLNTGAVEAMVGRMSDGSPLRAWSAQFGPKVSAIMEQALPDAIGLGRSPRDVAKDLARIIDGSADRMLAHARTQILGAYRDASLQTYADNSDVLSGWTWVCALDNSCAACVSLHGSEHPLSETFFEAHPQCRCSPAPLVKDVSSPITTAGDDWFAGQSAAEQDKVLRGSEAGDAYRSGRVQLGDFVQRVENERWGAAHTQDSLSGAIERAAGRQDRRAA